jgi:hypothetical protein
VVVQVHIFGGAYEPLHRRDDSGHPRAQQSEGIVNLSDRIHAARVLVKVAEGSGGIASLQRHERDLVRCCAVLR